MTASPAPLRVAVVGSGIAGLSCAWLLSQRHTVTVFEAGDRLGGHTHTWTVDDGLGSQTAVDTGFIVYNETTYPNLTALFAHLGVATRQSDMSFAASLDDGALEYGSTDLASLFAQKRNLLRPRFITMLRDLTRFYREAPLARARGDLAGLTLGQYLDARGYSRAFRNDHLLPQAAAIWSASLDAIADHPAEAFVQFFENHGLLELNTAIRPQWRTVVGGSGTYIAPISASYGDRVRLNAAVTAVRSVSGGVEVATASGSETFDQVVIATHGDQALRMLAAPTPAQASVLSAFRYSRNRAVLHTDLAFMPRRRAAWSAWNYVGGKGATGEVTYWMNRLQGLSSKEPLLVSLNPARTPDPAKVVAEVSYEHPLFDHAAVAAQAELWSLQGEGGVWFCGAHFGAGFHEDGLQSGLAVAEQLGGVRRPWSLADESGRIVLGPAPVVHAEAA